MVVLVGLTRLIAGVKKKDHLYSETLSVSKVEPSVKGILGLCSHLIKSFRRPRHSG